MNHKWRAYLGAISIVILSAAGVVTNVLTDDFEPRWWFFWSVLIVCAIVVHLGISRLDRNSMASRPSEEAVTAAPQETSNGVTLHAGRDIASGLDGRHHVGVVLIFGVVAVLAPSLPVLLKGDPQARPSVAGSPSSPSAGPLPAVERIPRVVRGMQTDSSGRRTYDLLMDRGYAYDIDIEGNENPLKNYGAGESEPGDGDRDLYLSGQSSVPRVWELYVPEPPNRSPSPAGS